jgi:hypothetical protein
MEPPNQKLLVMLTITSAPPQMQLEIATGDVTLLTAALQANTSMTFNANASAHPTPALTWWSGTQRLANATAAQWCATCWLSGTATLVDANALPKIAMKVSSGHSLTANASAKTMENACQARNGTNCLVHAAAQPVIALLHSLITMELPENNTGMKMFANADVSQSTVSSTNSTVMALLIPMSTGDSMAQDAFAFINTKTACQDSAGMKLQQFATALQSPAQLTTTGTETSALANAIQRNVLKVLTGRNHGANAETYHLNASQLIITMTGDTIASACQTQHHLQEKLMRFTTGTKLPALGLWSPMLALQVNSTTMKTKFAVAMNNLALLAITSMSTPTFAAADASQAFAQLTTTGTTKFANANAPQR